jgi:carboxyl-terminal processing protease
MKEHLRRLWLITVVVIALLLGMAGGMVIDRRGAFALGPQPGATASSTASLNTGLINEAFDLIQRRYVDRSAIQSDKLTDGAISGMVDALGDTGHTVFLSPQMVKQERDFTQGQFEGIGAEVEMKNGNVVIAAPIDNSPAQKAGLQPGDIILKVDGQDMTGLTLDQVVQHVAGPAGTTVTLTIQDAKTGATRDVKVTRARIVVPAVTWQMLPGTRTAHVRIAAFSENVSSDLQAALAAAKQQGATGIILDLRNNPGGLLDGAVGVTSQFLRGGNVLQEKDAQGRVQDVPVKSNLPKTDLPVVVLTNAGTASAAEITAGALQDAGRAQLVGETTFGTGTVLNQFPLSDGSALMLAIEEWLTPKGRTIWHQGIAPDVTVQLPQSTNPLTPDTEKGMTLDQIKSSGDAQLIKALDMITQATTKQAHLSLSQP